MKHNPIAQILDRRMEDRRAVERDGMLDRRARIPHFRHADIRRVVIALNLGDRI